MFLKKINRKGFTLIELLTIIAILGILVLLAAPKFLGYTEQTRLAQIKNDVKAHEITIDTKLTSDLSYQDEIDKWNQIGKEELNKAFEEKRLFDKKGLVTSSPELSCKENGNNNEDDNYEIKVHKSNGLFLNTATIGNIPSASESDCSEIPKKYVNSKLSGKFIYGEGGVFYIHNKSANTIVDENNFGSILACNEKGWETKANPASDFEGFSITREMLESQAAEIGKTLDPPVDGMTVEQYLMMQGSTEEQANMQIEAMVNKYTITNYVGTSKNVVIPCEINGMPVSSIEGLQGEDFTGAFQEMQLESVIFPTTLQNIGTKAFDKNKLKEIKIPDSVKYISFGAFRDNPIRKLDLGNGVVTIGSSAFKTVNVFNSNPLTELTLPASLQSIAASDTFHLADLKIVNNYSNLDVSSYFEYDSGIEIINH